LKRLTVCVIAAVSVGILCGGTASASELIVRPRLQVNTLDCVSAGSFGQDNQLQAYVENEGMPCGRVYVPRKRLEALLFRAWGGYYPEKEKEQKCSYHRSVLLYLNGSPFETREFGDFRANGALFSPWKQIDPTNAEFQEVWPPGKYELRSAGFSYHAKVYKLNGPPQGEAKSYPAKIVCEKLTLDLGSTR
jgi:hypothetical protein